MREYGPLAFEVKTITGLKRENKLPRLENKYINKYNSISSGYNMSKGGAIGKRGKGINFKGKIYSSRRTLCKKYKVSYDLVSGRLQLGWSLKKALLEPKNKSGSSISVKWNGICYSSIKAAARAHNLNDRTLSNMLKARKKLRSKLKSTKKRGK